MDRWALEGAQCQQQDWKNTAVWTLVRNVCYLCQPPLLCCSGNALHLLLLRIVLAWCAPAVLFWLCYACAYRAVLTSLCTSSILQIALLSRSPHADSLLLCCLCSPPCASLPLPQRPARPPVARTWLPTATKMRSRWPHALPREMLVTWGGFRYKGTRMGGCWGKLEGAHAATLQLCHG